MSTTPHQPERDDDDLLLAAEAEAQERPARVEEPEVVHPRIPASVSRRLQDRSAGVEFDPKAIRSTRPEAPSRPTRPTPRVVAPPVPEPTVTRAEPAPPADVPAQEPAGTASERAAAPEPTTSAPAPAAATESETGAMRSAETSGAAGAGLPAAGRPTRCSRMAQLPTEERRDRPTALAGGLPSGRRPASDDAAPAPWGRLVAHDQHDVVPALSLGAPAPKPISAEDVDPGQGAPDDSVAEAGADGTGRGTFTTVRIVLGVVLLLLVIALVLLFLL